VGVRSLSQRREGVVILSASLERLALVIADLRPDWPLPSIHRALCACDGHEPAELALAAVRVASDPATKSPTRMTLAGPWWLPVDFPPDKARHLSAIPPPPAFAREHVRPADPKRAAALSAEARAVIRAARAAQPEQTEETRND
jgi:hypothetical protein